MPRRESYGFKVIVQGRVYGARTLGEAAERLVKARAAGATNVRAKVCTSLTRDRDMSEREQQALVEAAARLVRDQLVAAG